MTTVELASLIVAILLAASRLLPASEALWKFLPSKIRWLPPVLLVALPQAAGYFGMVQTKLDLVEAVLLTVALVVPGARSAAHSNLAKASGRGFSAFAALCDLMAVSTVVGGCVAIAVACTPTQKAIAKTAVETAAELLCADFFARQRGITLEDARVAFCQYKDVLDPFLEQAKAAQLAAGTTVSTAQPPGDGAP